MTVTVIRIGDTMAAAQSNVSDRSKHTSWLALLATANFGYVGPPGSWGLDMRRIGKDECGLRAHLLKNVQEWYSLEAEVCEPTHGSDYTPTQSTPPWLLKKNPGVALRLNLCALGLVLMAKP